MATLSTDRPINPLRQRMKPDIMMRGLLVGAVVHAADVRIAMVRPICSPASVTASRGCAMCYGPTVVAFGPSMAAIDVMSWTAPAPT